jgi:hypothetical protein
MPTRPAGCERLRLMLGCTGVGCPMHIISCVLILIRRESKSKKRET